MLFQFLVFLVTDNAPGNSHGYVVVVLLSGGRRESTPKAYTIYAAWVSSRQELLQLLFSPKGIRWYLMCSCQVREVSVTNFYSLLLSRQRYSLEPAKVHTLAARVFLVSAKDGQSVGSLPELRGRLDASSA